MVNRSYAECAEHYGFLIAPCRPRTPEHKGKVESGVHFVKRNFLAGRAAMEGISLHGMSLQGSSMLELDRANREARRWCLEEAGRRCHGTTKEAPLERFEREEKAALRRLPDIPYDPGDFRRVKLHRDCHVVFDHCYYSAPFTLVGQMLLVRGGLSTVRIYDSEHNLVATHTRASQPGTRVCVTDHLPPHKVPALLRTRESCLEQAGEIGPCTLEVVQTLLDDPVRDRLNAAGRLVQLRQRYGAERLENACRRAISFQEYEYKTVKGILESGSDVSAGSQTSVTGPHNAAGQHSGHPPFVAPNPDGGISSSLNGQNGQTGFLFVRSAEELLGHLFHESGGTQGSGAQGSGAQGSGAQGGESPWL